MRAEASGAIDALLDTVKSIKAELEEITPFVLPHQVNVDELDESVYGQASNAHHDDSV